MTLASVLPPTAKFLDCSRHAQGLYIGGQWVGGSGIPVIDPST